MSRRREEKHKYDKSVYRSLLLISQFGFNMIVPIGLMSAAGIWLDRRFDTSFWTVILFFVGAVAGGQNIFRMSKQFFDADEKKEPGAADEDNRDVEKQK